MSDILHGGRLPSFAVCERQEAPVITSLGRPLARILRDTLRYTHSKASRAGTCIDARPRSRIQLKASPPYSVLTINETFVIVAQLVCYTVFFLSAQRFIIDYVRNAYVITG